MFPGLAYVVISAKYLNSQYAHDVNFDSISERMKFNSLFPLGLSMIAPNSVKNLPTPNDFAAYSFLWKKRVSIALQAISFFGTL